MITSDKRACVGQTDCLREADLSLPNLDRDMEFVWTLKHSDKTNWQRSSSVQIKPPRFTTRPLLGLGPRACGLVRKRCTKHVRQHLPRKRCGDEGVQYAVEPAWNDSGAVFDQTAEASDTHCSTLIGFIGIVFGSRANFSSTAVFVTPAASTVT
jgi:hypothetical protein